MPDGVLLPHDGHHWKRLKDSLPGAPTKPPEDVAINPCHKMIDMRGYMEEIYNNYHTNVKVWWSRLDLDPLEQDDWKYVYQVLEPKEAARRVMPTQIKHQVCAGYKKDRVDHVNWDPREGKEMPIVEDWFHWCQEISAPTFDYLVLPEDRKHRIKVENIIHRGTPVHEQEDGIGGRPAKVWEYIPGRDALPDGELPLHLRTPPKIMNEFVPPPEKGHKLYEQARREFPWAYSDWKPLEQDKKPPSGAAPRFQKPSKLYERYGSVQAWISDPNGHGIVPGFLALSSLIFAFIGFAGRRMQSVRKKSQIPLMPA